MVLFFFAILTRGGWRSFWRDAVVCGPGTQPSFADYIPIVASAFGCVYVRVRMGVEGEEGKRDFLVEV